MKILLDNGHGVDTPGKRSPIYNGQQLFEWRLNRDVVKKIANKLNSIGIQSEILVNELNDVPLQERCNRANRAYLLDKTCVLISIHANAGGGTGWECYTSIGQTKSDKYASILCNEFKINFPNKNMRFDFSDGDADKEDNFYILKNTNCPAILLENFFMDNQVDFDIIISEVGIEKISQTIVDAIKKFILV